MKHINGEREPVAIDPVKAAENLDRAFEEFLKAYPHIPREEALRMWREAGG
jgi:hypothetical protein